MAQIVYAEEANADLGRIWDFLQSAEPDAAPAVLRLIDEALLLLRSSPLIGRPTETGLRELVISRGRSGYVAVYRFMEAEDVILVLAIRHQREANYLPD